MGVRPPRPRCTTADRTTQRSSGRIWDESTLPYALNLTLDPTSSLEVERLYRRLVQQGVSERDIISQYGPCVTLLVMSDSAHADDIAEAAAHYLRKCVVFPITFTGACVVGLPLILGMRIAPDDRLLSLHNAIYNSFPEQQVHLHYRPAHWQPHLKLSNLRSVQAEAVKLVDALNEERQTQHATSEALELIHYVPVQSIWQAPFRRALSQSS